MRNSKKLILIIVVMLVALFSIGCGEQGKKSTSVPAPTVTKTPTATPTKAPTNTPTPTTNPDLLPKLKEEEVPNTERVMDLYSSSSKMAELEKKVAEEKVNPAINITTYNNANITSRDRYIEAVIDVFNCESEYRLTATAGVKVRGNSTSNEDPKPFRIKFEEKQSMLGLHDGNAYKSWVLLKPYWNVCPDLLAFTIYDVASNGQYYSSDSVFVNLYLNGSYKGIYMLCEQNQANEGRVEVYEPKEDEDSCEIGYLLEIDNYPGEDHHYFTLKYGKRSLEDFQGEERKIPEDHISVKSDIYTKSQLAKVESFMNNVYEICYYACVENKAYELDETGNLAESKKTPEAAVAAVVDLESVVDMYIVEELMQNYDVGAGSFYMAIDFSENAKYDRLTFLAPWDFNWAGYEAANGGFYAGTWQKLMDDKYDRSHSWFITFMRAAWFQDMVREKLEEFSSGTKFEAAIKGVEDYMEVLRPDYGDEGWRADSGRNYCNYVRQRLEYLRENL